MNAVPARPCFCTSLPEPAAVAMGGDGLDERVFATFDHIRDYGPDRWWLYLSKCSRCGQDWMIAQEERIFDDYFLRRLSLDEAERTVGGVWPDDFLTYEQVLQLGHSLSKPCRFFNPLASSLVWTADDLRKERPDISVGEIAYLLGVATENAARLLEANVR